MNGRLPSANLSPAIALASGVIIIALAVIAVGFYTQNQTLNQQLVQQQTELSIIKARGMTFLFNPNKRYVTSSTTTQQVIGTVVSFDQNTSNLTLENSGETFQVPLPLGSKVTYTPSSYANVKDMYKFQTGDTVEIAGRYNLDGSFEIYNFIIIQKGQK